jgi:hypothetical protein
MVEVASKEILHDCRDSLEQDDALKLTEPTSLQF